MLSTSVIKSVSGAGHYFSAQDNYYTLDEGVSHSEWVGSGAKKLGMVGQVNAEQFTTLLAGRLPDGQQLGKVMDGKIQHRPGWDLTFSAPKSVSLLALIDGDQRLIAAHQVAVKKTLQVIEQGCAQARIKTREGMAYENTGNLIAALYHHDLSRAEDPQLHTHCVVMNMTVRRDGRWRSLASQSGRYDQQSTTVVNGFIERIRHDKRFYGKIYETELAFQIKQLGYEIEINPKTGVFEIAGVPQAAIHAFSKRRQHIEAVLAEKGVSGAKASEIAALDKRDRKKTVERTALHASWRFEAERCGLTNDVTMAARSERQSPAAAPHSFDAVADERATVAIKLAAHHLSQFKTTFSREALVTEALPHVLQHGISMDRVMRALEVVCQEGHLISIAREGGGIELISQESLNDEKKITAALRDKVAPTPCISSATLDVFLSQRSDLQQDALPHLKTIFNAERVVILEGRHTKEQFIQPIIELANAVGLNIALVSPTARGGRHFALELQPKPTSFWQRFTLLFNEKTLNHYGIVPFLATVTNESSVKSRQPNLIIVDNAHLLSTTHKAQLLEWNVANESKLILLGDRRLLLPQARGASLETLIEQGVNTIALSEPAHPPHATAQQTHAEMTTMIATLSERIIEVSTDLDRLQAMVHHFSNLDVKTRQNSWLVAPTKTNVEILNERAHQALKDTQQLGKAITLNVLIPVFVPAEKVMLATTYLPQHVLRFNESYTSLPVERGEYVRILSHHSKSNRVILEKANGKTIAWYPDKVAGTQPGRVELFKEKAREFCVGERLIAQRSLKSCSISQGDRLTLHSLRDSFLRLKSDTGKWAIIDIKDAHCRHFDYGYATTPHLIAHEKSEQLIADFPTRSTHINQRYFLQVVSSSKESWIYTDRILECVTQIEKKAGHRLSAHEVVEHASQFKKTLHCLYDVLDHAQAEAPSLTTLSRSAVDAVDYALLHLTERDAGFTHQQVIETALNHALGKVTLEQVTRVIEDAEKKGVMIQGQINEGIGWTTLEAVRKERRIIELCQREPETLAPIDTEGWVEKHADASTLNADQKSVVSAITQNRDRIMAIQGYAGTGKTTLLAFLAELIAAKEAMHANGYEILGLAPTNKAVSELRQRGIPAQTLDSFIIQRKGDQQNSCLIAKPNLVLVIDEASMISNSKALEILSLTHEMKARAIVVGDVRQLPAVEAGKPQSLIQSYVKTYYLTDIRRQEDVVLKRAVKETIACDYKAAFKTLKSSLIESRQPTQAELGTLGPKAAHEKIRDERIAAMVQDYITYPKELRSAIQVITPGHDDRVMTNAAVRAALKNEGTLSQAHDKSLTILTSKKLTNVESAQITNLTVGDVLRFNQSTSGGINASEYLTLIDKQDKHRLLTLRTEEGRSVMIQLPAFDKTRPHFMEIYARETRALQPGDEIRWTRTIDKAHELFSTEIANVMAVEKDRVTVRLANQKTFSFDAKNPKYQHWDHGYAATVYAVQGDKKSIILSHQESYRENLTSQPSFMVALTRAVNQFRIYTDNTRALLAAIERHPGIKLSALEVIGESTKMDVDAKKIRSTKEFEPDI